MAEMQVSSFQSLAKARFIHLRVDQGAGDRPMSQGLLDQEHVSGPLVETAREGVPEAVDRCLPGDAGLLAPQVKPALDMPGCEALAVPAWEQGS